MAAAGLSTTVILNGAVLKAKAGDAAAREQLLEMACERLRHLIHKQLRQSAVHRWEQTDDVLQGVLMRLHRALASVEIRDLRHFLALSSVEIRRELIDLWRHYYGPEGEGRHHATVAGDSSQSHDTAPLAGAADAKNPQPEQMLALHEQVEKLPEELREVVDVLWYQGLSRPEAAELLGVSLKTVDRRWRQARLALGQALEQ